MKKLIRTLHLIIGLTTGIVVFIVAVTGCLTSFEEELRGIVHRDLYEVKETSKEMKSLDEIVKVAKAEFPKEKIKNIHVKSDEQFNAEIQFQNRITVYVNPYTGKVVGKLEKDKDFFGVVLDLHKNLLMDETGETITGISALLFLIMLISGIILWWPAKKSNKKQKFTLMRNAKWPKRIYDLHSVLGFYASWIIIFTVLTGLIWSFEWAEDILYWSTNSKKEKRIELESNKAIGSQKNIDYIYYAAISNYPEHQECIIYVPENEKGTFRVLFRYENNGFYRRMDNIFFDQYTGEIIANKKFDDLSAGDKMKMTNVNIHTGKVLGLTGQLLVFFAGLICASLPVTGFLMWRRRIKDQKKLQIN